MSFHTRQQAIGLVALYETRIIALCCNT